MLHGSVNDVLERAGSSVTSVAPVADSLVVESLLNSIDELGVFAGVREEDRVDLDRAVSFDALDLMPQPLP